MKSRIASLLISAALIAPPVLTIAGCDREISHEEHVKERPDGTGVKEEKTVKEKPDGTVVTEKEKTVDKTPDR